MSAPVCAVKPLPPTPLRLVEDLADTVSAIEAISSFNNGVKDLGNVSDIPFHLPIESEQECYTEVFSTDQDLTAVITEGTSNQQIQCQVI